MNDRSAAMPADGPTHPIERHHITDDEALDVLDAGGAVRVGKLVMTAAADGSSFTLTDPAGGSSTFRSCEEFDEELARARWVTAGRRAGGAGMQHGQAAPAFAMAFTAGGGWELIPCPPAWALDLLAELA